MKPEYPVRMIPLYAGDLAVATHRIEHQLPAGGLRFKLGLLVGILNPNDRLAICAEDFDAKMRVNWLGNFRLPRLRFSFSPTPSAH